MYEMNRHIQMIVDEIDRCIEQRSNEELTLRTLSQKLGYSEFYVARKFKEISGINFKDYLRRRKLAFALKDIRDSKRGILDIALDYGFSTHEAFTRSFKAMYGITPCEYRKKPVPLVLRTKLCPFDRYFLGIEENDMNRSASEVKTYFVTIPAHKFLYVKNYDSNGYWDFWQKQAQIPGHDCDTICGLLDSIKGKLDDEGGSEANSGAGQIMAYIYDPKGQAFFCGQEFSHGVPRLECYGVRLPMDYDGEVPPQMTITDIPEAEYIVFEHGHFDYEKENCIVEKKVDEAIESFDFTDTGYCYDDSVGRIAYFYHDPARFWKVVRPIKKVQG
ncbi:MAG: AraC family transcriptional regulator [Oscillospiraceae bacterium]|nr:AraC family transcriptional regulator [Oscillospiraceae bacterium]